MKTLEDVGLPGRKLDWPWFIWVDATTCIDPRYVQLLDVDVDAERVDIILSSGQITRIHAKDDTSSAELHGVLAREVADAKCAQVDLAK